MDADGVVLSSVSAPGAKLSLIASLAFGRRSLILLLVQFKHNVVSDNSDFRGGRYSELDVALNYEENTQFHSA
jgi:hypothetical protein